MADKIPLFTKEQLNNMDRDSLIDLVLRAQEVNMLFAEKIAVMNTRMFGRSTERLGVEGQTSFEGFFNEFEAEYVSDENNEEEPTVKEATKRRGNGKKTTLSRFEKKHVYHSLPKAELEKIFGVNGWKELPDQQYEKLEVVPRQYYVVVHHVKVYAAKKGDQIVRAEHPKELMEKSMATPSLVAAILNGKYVNHMPTRRISSEFERNGLNLSNQVMSRWVIKVCENTLMPLWQLMKEYLLSENIIQADETPCYVTKDGRPRNSKSYMWVYRNSELDKEKSIILFNYDPGRSTDSAMTYLDKYRGFIECDGYSVYESIERICKNIEIANCWTHARRGYATIVKTLGRTNNSHEEMSKGLSHEAIKLIGKIFNRDSPFKDKTSEERLHNRQEVVKPLVDEYFKWVKTNIDDVLPGSELYRTMQYSIKRERSLRRFLENGDIPIDNSATERAIRPFTMGRNSWKLIDTVNGAKRSAIAYSITESAKANGLKPYEYLKYILTEIPKIPLVNASPDKSELNKLLPWSDQLPAECIKKPNR